MKQTTIVLVMFGTLITGSPTVYADSENPFGFETNTHPLEYEYCKKGPGSYRGHDEYECSSAPRPHPELKKYKLLFIEDVGLCYIRGFTGKKFVTEDFATRLFGQVTSKYGPPLNKNIESTISDFYWSPEDGFNGLGEVEKIQLSVSLSGRYNSFLGWVRIYFTLVTFDACEKKIDDKGKNAF